MTYLKALAAYLTGWVIANVLYARVRKTALDAKSEEWADTLAFRLADEWERRLPSKREGYEEIREGEYAEDPRR